MMQTLACFCARRMWICTLLLVCSCLSVSGCSTLPAEHRLVTATEGEVRIPLRDVDDGKVHFFTFKKSGKRINFFARTDGSGTLSFYYDACFTCYKHKKGYRAEGTDIVCNECSMKFRLADDKWDNSKGCSPILLKSRLGRENVIILADDLEKGMKLF